MLTIAEIADEIVAREGGDVDDPDDPGGPTNLGVTLKTLRGLGIDVDGDGVVGRADLLALTPLQARGIFLRHYYDAPRIAELPETVQPSVFDMYVNAGNNAVKILQRLLGRMGHGLTVDGVIGPQTRAAAALAQSSAPRHFADAYGIERRNYYYGLGDARAALRSFIHRNTDVRTICGNSTFSKTRSSGNK
ncbi:hypothetical protein LCGC14_3063770 [marine sediment metagenome]|uniref:Uncharacterized protein n=1 Tax=marine sediment metagenome TaxID=412755 RepID=A0A0F8YQV9_9ZZZZ